MLTYERTPKEISEEEVERKNQLVYHGLARTFTKRRSVSPSKVDHKEGTIKKTGKYRPKTKIEMKDLLKKL